jgi:hypothetical protein
MYQIALLCKCKIQSMIMSRCERTAQLFPVLSSQYPQTGIIKRQNILCKGGGMMTSKSRSLVLTGDLRP